MIHPIVQLGLASAWADGQCTVYADETDTAYWQVTAIPDGVSLVGGTTQFTGDVTLIFQLNDPIAFAASDKSIRVQGFINNNIENIHIFTTSGGYQTMAAVSQSMNAAADPDYVTLQDATGGFALHKITQTLSGDIPKQARRSRSSARNTPPTRMPRTPRKAQSQLMPTATAAGPDYPMARTT
jgi:hypothetical protein